MYRDEILLKGLNRVKVVQEYERAVIFRLGRLRKGGAKGPGIFFVIPCVDNFRCVDMRTVSFDVPPQEVGQGTLSYHHITSHLSALLFTNYQAMRKTRHRLILIIFLAQSASLYKRHTVTHCLHP